MKARYIVVLALSSSFILPAQAGGELAFWKRLAPVVERGAVPSPTLARVLAEVRALENNLKSLYNTSVTLINEMRTMMNAIAAAAPLRTLKG